MLTYIVKRLRRLRFEHEALQRMACAALAIGPDVAGEVLDDELERRLLVRVGPASGPALLELLGQIALERRGVGIERYNRVGRADVHKLIGADRDGARLVDAGVELRARERLVGVSAERPTPPRSLAQPPISATTRSPVSSCAMPRANLMPVETTPTQTPGRASGGSSRGEARRRGPRSCTRPRRRRRRRPRLRGCCRRARPPRRGARERSPRGRRNGAFHGGLHRYVKQRVVHRAYTSNSRHFEGFSRTPVVKWIAANPRRRPNLSPGWESARGRD